MSTLHGVKNALVAFAVLVGTCLAAACADTYCQSGPQHGTSCYSGATVQQNDPLRPVTPNLNPPGHGGVSSWLKRDPQDAAPPQMFGHPKAQATSSASSGAPDALDASAE